MDDFDPAADNFLAAMMANITTTPLSAIAAEDIALFNQLRVFDPIQSAATFGGLLMIPGLQSNCIRLEVLAHISLAMGKGAPPPSDKLIKRLFARTGKGVCGRLEDPAEDVFATSISSPRGNFRVLEGTWESAGFYLQRVLNVVESFPGEGTYADFKECIYALLKLSDLMCARAGLERYQLGNDVREQRLPDDVVEKLGELRDLVTFSEEELHAAGIKLQQLAAFGFTPADREKLLDAPMGHSVLERYPLILRDKTLYVTLPTTITAAIRRFVLEEMDATGMREAFLGFLALEYGDLFSRAPLLGGRRGAPIEFKRTPKGMLAEALVEVEPGRFLQFVFSIDTLEGFEIGGLAGHNPDPTHLEEDFNRWIDHAYDQVSKATNFRDGITLFVGCGVGRGAAYSFDRKERANWRVQFISAADLYTLSWVPDFKPLSLWRLMEALDKLASMGVELQNVNGLLNMVAWGRDLEGHLVPHSQLPDNLSDGTKSIFIMTRQNALRDLRYEVARCWDTHSELGPDGRWIRVRKEAEAQFKEDRDKPAYVSDEELGDRRILAAYEATNRPWWAEVETPDESDGYYVYQRWQMMMTWLSRAAPILDAAFAELPRGPVLWRARFSGLVGKLPGDIAKMSADEAGSLLTVSADLEKRQVTLSAEPRFEEAHFNEDNIAERAIVEKLIVGTAMLAGRVLNDSEVTDLINKIVPDGLARQTHMFRANSFRDYVQSSVGRVIKIDHMDVATMRLGLGWRVRARSESPRIEGKPACLQYLSDLVKLIEAELCNDLRLFDRRATISKLLHNHEAAVIDRERWMRTSAAVISLHEDKMDARTVIAEHDFELNAIFQATRLLTEIAICECPLEGGRVPAESDISRLMGQVMMVQQFGGWSDAMRWDVMEPTLRITPLGDVHAKLGFVDDVIEPFARLTADVRVTEAVEKYATHLEKLPAARSADDVFGAQFLAAMEEEVGASLDQLRVFMDFADDIGLRTEKAVFALPKSALLAAKFDGEPLSKDSVAAFVDYLTLRPRPHWRDVPPGFDDRDRQPWRFRRRLSVLRKPLIQLDDGEDPTLIVVPGLVRDAVTYMLGNFLRGDFPGYQLKPAMRAWGGRSRDQVGHAFGKEVAARLKELGWETDCEVKITRLLKQGFPRNYGDVDVLAWSSASGRVLIVECKDVQYRKNYGEICEQLADFRGDNGPDGKPDLLRKHLDRVELLREHLPALAKFIGWDRVSAIESHLIFKNPVPMEFAMKHMAEKVTVGLFDHLDRIS